MADDTAAAEVDQQPDAGEEEERKLQTDENKKESCSPTLSDKLEPEEAEEGQQERQNLKEQQQQQQRQKPQSEAQVTLNNLVRHSY